MNFESKSERQIIEESLLEKGDYDATVLTAENDTSKAGNEMIVLQLQVFGQNGRTVPLKDWLLPSMPMKLIRFCQSAGLMDLYNKGQLQAGDCIGRDVCVAVKVEEDKSGQYPPQNKVAGYKVKAENGGQNAPAPSRSAESPVSDEPKFEPADIPF
jgi:hypothetical protein